jgi:hypothetical protein
MSPQVIRPSRERYGKTLFASAGLAVVLIVIAVGQSTAGARAGVGALAAAAALVALGVGLHWRNARIEIEPGRVARTNLLGITTDLPIGSVATVLIALRFASTAAVPVERLFLFDADGAVLLRMRGEAWDVESMAAVGAAIPVAPIVIAETIGPDELRRRFPGAVEPWEAHPTRYGLAIGALVVAVIAVGGILR